MAVHGVDKKTVDKVPMKLDRVDPLHCMVADPN